MRAAQLNSYDANGSPRYKTPGRSRGQGGLFYQPDQLNMKFDYEQYIDKKAQREEIHAKNVARYEMEQEEKEE